jgi:hypothetical protein
MTIQRALNVDGDGGNWVVFYIKEVLKAAGWTVTRSGSGTGGVFDTSDVFLLPAKGGSQVVGVGIGSETLGNQNCWLVLEDPGGNRQIIFVRDGTLGDSYDDEWYMGYSPGGLFIGGSAAGAATATDEEQVSAAGSKGSPSPVYQPGGSANKIHIAADDVASPEGEYGFICVEVRATNTIQSLTGLDDRRDNATGDTAANILFQEVGPLSAGDLLFGKCMCDPLGAPSWQITSMSRVVVNNQNYQLNGRVSEIDSKERPLPVWWVQGSVYGYRGSSRWFKYPAIARDYPNTGEVKTLLYLDDYQILDLFDGVTTPQAI